ncbi:MAG: NADP-dependent phosphogluconate dehydrogenase [Bacteroidota bacterium]
MTKAVFGIIGLGVMGSSLAKNIAGKGISLSVYNRTAPGEEKVVLDFLDEMDLEHVQGHLRLVDFVGSLALPRKIMIMVSAGPAVDAVLQQLQPLLDPGDVVIDGGNSHYQDTQRRATHLAKDLVHFLGIGVSGGEEGALTGPSMMAGGAADAYSIVREVLESMAAKDANKLPCVSLLGPDGSGHFVKTLHNGIEYAEMQLLAECYDLLRSKRSNEEIANIFDGWRGGGLDSFLLNITVDILRFKDGKDYLLDKILDVAGSKGTGTWSSQAALQLGVPATMIQAAVNARFLSSMNDKRKEYNELRTHNSTDGSIDAEALKQAYTMARIINFHEGFRILKAASQEYGWDFDLSEIARVWTEGCIIKSAMMQQLTGVLKQTDDIFRVTSFRDALKNSSALRVTLQYGVSNQVPTPCLSAAMQYWLSISSESLPANLIQAQRDYFGAHTYKRNDRPSSEDFTTNWKTHG